MTVAEGRERFFIKVFWSVPSKESEREGEEICGQLAMETALRVA
jgi:hypothetical protein